MVSQFPTSTRETNWLFACDRSMRLFRAQRKMYSSVILRCIRSEQKTGCRQKANILSNKTYIDSIHVCVDNRTKTLFDMFTCLTAQWIGTTKLCHSPWGWWNGVGENNITTRASTAGWLVIVLCVHINSISVLVCCLLYKHKYVVCCACSARPCAETHYSSPRSTYVNILFHLNSKSLRVICEILIFAFVCQHLPGLVFFDWILIHFYTV